jgi:hypothetical protein
MGDPYTDVTHFDNTLISGNPYILFGDGNYFTTEEVTRINTELLLWKFYKGNQWKRKRVDGEPQITLNYCRAFVDKGVSFLMGKGFTINTKDQADEIIKPLLDEVWDDNNRNLVGLDIAQSGGVTGNSWVKVAVETFDETRPDMLEQYPKGRIRIIVLPTYAVFPTFHGHDRDRLVRCRIIYPLYTQDPDRGGNLRYAWYIEDITTDEIVESIDGKEISRRPNELREIPVVRIKNLPLAGDVLGISDLQDIVPLQIEMNNKATDVSDIINYHAAPITVITGAKATNLEKGNRKIWSGLPKEAKVSNLELQSDLGAAMNYLEFVKTGMFELAHMPEDAFGKKLAVSNTSGIALHIKNQPIVETTHNKWITYGEGLSQINRLILKYAKLIEYPGFDLSGFEKLKPAEKYWTAIQFADPLPKDELIQMQLIAQKISLYLESRKEAMAELGETEVEEKFAEILKEAEEIKNRLGEMVEEGEGKAKTTNTGGIVQKTEKAKGGG